MRAPIKVRRVDLVRVDDPAYVEEMSRQAAAHRRLGPRQDPGDLYRASGLVEAAVRTWLGERLPLLDERIIDAELLPPGERAYVRRFQELDAVIGRAGEPERVVEMKFSANGGAVRRGISQLGRARALLRHRWPDVAGLLVLVEANRTGVELDFDRLREVELVGPEALSRPDSLHPTTLIVLTAADLADHLDAKARGVIERGHDEGDALTAARLTRAARDSEADDAMGAPQASPGWPAQAPSATFDTGDEPDASPFAALAGLHLDSEDDTEAPGG
ncbi:MAG: hypothetical protein ABWY52_02520 [Candidatus Limnocylindrales bacterium]